MGRKKKKKEEEKFYQISGKDLSSFIMAYEYWALVPGECRADVIALAWSKVPEFLTRGKDMTKVDQASSAFAEYIKYKILRTFKEIPKNGI